MTNLIVKGGEILLWGTHFIWKLLNLGRQDLYLEQVEQGEYGGNYNTNYNDIATRFIKKHS